MLSNGIACVEKKTLLFGGGRFYRKQLINQCYRCMFRRCDLTRNFKINHSQISERCNLLPGVSTADTELCRKFNGFPVGTAAKDKKTTRK